MIVKPAHCRRIAITAREPRAAAIIEGEPHEGCRTVGREPRLAGPTQEFVDGGRLEAGMKVQFGERRTGLVGRQGCAAKVELHDA